MLGLKKWFRKFAEEYLTKKTDVGHIQFFRYFFVGALSAILDTSIFFVVSNFFGLHYMVAQTVGFTIGILVNYSLSVAWIFESNGQVKQEVFRFAIIGASGLLLGSAILWIMIESLDIHSYHNMLAKAVSVLIVFFWNFWMRKNFAFIKNK